MDPKENSTLFDGDCIELSDDDEGVGLPGGGQAHLFSLSLKNTRKVAVIIKDMATKDVDIQRLTNNTVLLSATNIINSSTVKLSKPQTQTHPNETKNKPIRLKGGYANKTTKNINILRSSPLSIKRKEVHEENTTPKIRKLLKVDRRKIPPNAKIIQITKNATPLKQQSVQNSQTESEIFLLDDRLIYSEVTSPNKDVDLRNISPSKTNINSLNQHSTEASTTTEDEIILIDDKLTDSEVSSPNINSTEDSRITEDEIILIDDKLIDSEVASPNINSTEDSRITENEIFLVEDRLVDSEVAAPNINVDPREISASAEIIQSTTNITSLNPQSTESSVDCGFTIPENEIFLVEDGSIQCTNDPQDVTPGEPNEILLDPWYISSGKSNVQTGTVIPVDISTILTNSKQVPVCKSTNENQLMKNGRTTIMEDSTIMSAFETVFVDPNNDTFTEISETSISKVLDSQTPKKARSKNTKSPNNMAYPAEAIELIRKGLEMIRQYNCEQQKVVDKPRKRKSSETIKQKKQTPKRSAKSDKTTLQSKPQANNKTKTRTDTEPKTKKLSNIKKVQQVVSKPKVRKAINGMDTEPETKKLSNSKKVQQVVTKPKVSKAINSKQNSPKQRKTRQNKRPKGDETPECDNDLCVVKKVDFLKTPNRIGFTKFISF